MVSTLVFQGVAMAFNYDGGDEDARIDERMLASVPDASPWQLFWHSIYKLLKGMK